MKRTKSYVKVELIKMLDALPDDLSWEDIQYHIYVRQKMERGLEDIEAGRVLSQEEVERQVKEWIQSARQGRR